MWNLKYTLRSISILAAFMYIFNKPVQAAGLPQLNFSTFPSQLIWLVITFAALLLLMSRVSLPRISQVLAERQHKIDENLKKAESFKEEAEIAAAAYTKAQAEARADAYAIIVETHKVIAADIIMKKAELSKEIETEIKAAEERIIDAKKVAMAGIADLSTDLAISTTERISGEFLNKKEVGKIVAKVMEERR